MLHRIEERSLTARRRRRGTESKMVARIYDALVAQLGPELRILRSSPVEEIADAGEPLVGVALQCMRDGQPQINPRYDGEYGQVMVFTDDERRQLRGNSR